jgi:hypothetical protein
MNVIYAAMPPHSREKAEAVSNSITEPGAVATGCEHSSGNMVRYLIHRQASVESVIRSLPLPGSVLSTIVQAQGFADQPLLGFDMVSKPFRTG